MKRFWTKCDAAPDGGDWAIRLDGRPVRTPARAPLIVPSIALADAIVAEWAAQREDIDPASMPLTGLANAAIDHVAPDPAGFAAALAAFGETDLLYYREDRDPALTARQAAAWDPLLAWAKAQYGAEFSLAYGIMHVGQLPETIAALAAALFRLNTFQLAAMNPLVTIGGSLIAALAIAERALTADTLWPLVTLDELYQEEKWGRDALACATRAHHAAAWDNAARFLMLL